MWVEVTGAGSAHGPVADAAFLFLVLCLNLQVCDGVSFKKRKKNVVRVICMLVLLFVSFFLSI